MTDVLVFTHLLYTPLADTSKPQQFSWLLTLRVGQVVARFAYVFKYTPQIFNYFCRHPLMPLNSPVRLIPAVGVTTTAPQNATSIFGDPAGAHYRTLLMFFMFQKKLKLKIYKIHILPSKPPNGQRQREVHPPAVGQLSAPLHPEHH